jgi:hypothetical protein
MGRSPQPALEVALAARRLPGPGGERTVQGAPGDGLLGGLALQASGAGVTSDRPGARVAAAGAEPGATAAAVVVPVGRGLVLLLADPLPLDNDHVARGDALSLWVRLAARGPIAFDERWLAPSRPAGASAPRPVTLAAFQTLLATLALLVAIGRRHGTVRPPPLPATRRTARDYLDALAVLYRRGGAEPALAAATWRRLRARLERDAGVPSRLPDEEAAGRLGPRWPATAGALRRGAAALARGGPGTLLAVTRAAADAEAGLRRDVALGEPAL